MKALEVLFKAQKPTPGLYPTAINVQNGEFPRQGGPYTIGALADSFYEYLLKLWLISDGEDESFRTRYEESADAIRRVLVKTTSDGYMYIGEGDENGVAPTMEHLVCTCILLIYQIR